MKQKGFAITGILYVLLMIFLLSTTLLLFNLQNRKTILDQLKLDVVGAVESENNYEYLLNKISELEAKVGTLDSKTTLSKQEKITNTVSVTSGFTNHTVLYTYTVPKTGYYLFNGYVRFPFPSNNATGRRAIQVVVTNSGSVTRDVRMAADTYYVTEIPFSEAHYLEEGQTVEFRAEQDSGVSLDVIIDMVVESTN